MADNEEAEFVCVDLNETGELLNERRAPVSLDELPRTLAATLRIPAAVTDIVVFVHGWRNNRQRATESMRRLLRGLVALHARHPGAYPAMPEFVPYGVAIRWPSMSNRSLHGYRRIRDRAHAMTTCGQASLVLAHILGYLSYTRRKPPGKRPRLQTADAQYLHCVGHSFGGRFLGEAIMAAARPSGPPRLLWPWHNPDYPYSVDTLVVFQMAARQTIFGERFSPLLSDSPISGPVALTFSRHDRATRRWHRLVEGAPGVGAFGARLPDGQAATSALHRIDEPYEEPMPSRVMNVDAGWRFRRGRWSRWAGAHSDIWHAESMHLLLGLAALAR